MMTSDELVDEIVRAIEGLLAERRPIAATYRLQFRGGQFGFVHAREIVGYLRDLGISHIYSSPILKARAGSTHGYDVADSTRLNDELGAADDFQAFVEELHRHDLGQLLDIVPNHMTVATDENLWWMDVLRSGPASPFANFFDIDWFPVKRELQQKVLLPFLGDLYGNVLERGELPILEQDGAFFVRCAGMRVPLDPQTWAHILSPNLDRLTVEGEPPADVLELQSILTALQYLPARGEVASAKVAERSRERVVIQGRLKRLQEQSPAVAAHVEHNLRWINGTPGDPRSFDALDQLLEAQVFRLVHWRASSDEINYRRFFDVSELAAVCTEYPDVFEAVHQFVFDLLARGAVDAFRVDHVDGLFDPPEYLWRLQWAHVRVIGRQALSRLTESQTEKIEWSAVESQVFERLHPRIGGPDPRGLFRSSRMQGPASQAPTPTVPASHSLPVFVLVEKILGVDEPLPAEWPVEGTTGYDFMSVTNGLFVHAAGLEQLTRHYTRFADIRDTFREIVYDCKWLVLSGAMQSDVQLLANRLDRLSNRNRHSRDYTLQALRTAIRELIACFPVYRTYIRGGDISDRDRRIVQLAVAQARRHNAALETSVFGFVRDVLLLTQPPELDAEGQAERDFFVGRFQQVTSPVMAKGVEDTAFYRYFPLVSLNEVGGEPTHAVTSPEEFHRQNIVREKHWPHAMLATTTHDTKRTEDVRARINVLSEVPGPWRSALQRWTRWNRKHRREVDGLPAPSRNDEWLFYQTLVGVWPLSPPTDQDIGVLVERLRGYMLKATREAKLRTSWVNPNAAYDEAVGKFVTDVISDSSGRFVADFQMFQDSLVDSGLYSSLAQVLLKLMSPGVPDIYQGQEIWDFSLVDPDNRRPVDYTRRRELLSDLIARASTEDGRLAFARHLAQNPRDDRAKLFVNWTALQFRRRAPGLFRESDYVPLAPTGPRAEHVCAFARRLSSSSNTGNMAIVVTPRLLQRLKLESGAAVPCGSDVWLNTALTVPEIGDARLRDAFTGGMIPVESGRLALARIFENFPLALLTDAIP